MDGVGVGLGCVFVGDKSWNDVDDVVVDV